MIVELGPGTRPHPLADIGIDLHHPKGGPPWDATDTPWPWTEGCASVVYSSHFLEHIPKGNPLIDVMNEAWNILKPGGMFIARFPLVGYTDPFSGEPQSKHIGWQPWADPTHVSYWWLPEAFLYFCEGPFKPNANYGIRTWSPLGKYIEPQDAELAIFDIRSEGPSFWSVVNTWEGIVRLIKP